jgi:hypothetical protein
MDSKARASLFWRDDFDNEPKLNNLKKFALVEACPYVNFSLTHVNTNLLTVNKTGAP